MTDYSDKAIKAGLHPLVVAERAANIHADRIIGQHADEAVAKLATFGSDYLKAADEAWVIVRRFVALVFETGVQDMAKAKAVVNREIAKMSSTDRIVAIELLGMLAGHANSLAVDIGTSLTTDAALDRDTDYNAALEQLKGERAAKQFGAQAPALVA